MLFATNTTLSVPAHRGDHVHGRRDRQQHPGYQLRAGSLAEGADRLRPRSEAGSTRFRPVLMTALAMIIGMVPMAVEPSQNAPLGRAVIGGLLFATARPCSRADDVQRCARARRKPAEACPCTRSNRS